MQITFLVSSFPVISEQFIINQVIGLIDAGIDVRIISLHDTKSSLLNPEVKAYNLNDRTESLSIPRRSYTILIKIFPMILRLLVHSPIRLLLALNVLRYNRAVFSLKTICILDAFRTRTIPIMHCHFGPNGVIGSFMKDANIVQNLITTFHGSDINSYPLRYGRNVYRNLFYKADKLTVNTAFTGNKVAAYGADRGKIEIVPVGLKCENYPYLKKDFNFSGSPVLLTVARLEEKKGYRYALDAMVEILKRYPDAVYHIVGLGSLKNELQELTSTLGLVDNVNFHGYCNRKKIFEFYREATVFLLPSVTASNGDMEGQGLVLQEAQAVGLPVISTLHNGIPDGVLEGETGFLVPEKDSDAIVEKIFYLTEHPSEAVQMGKSGRKFVQGKYDIPILTQKIMDVYKMVD